MKRMRRQGTIWLGTLALIGCVWLPMTAQSRKHSDMENIGRRDITDGSWNLYSLEKEVGLGRRLAGSVEQNAHLFEDAEVREYVDDLVQRLARNSDARVPFTVRVIDSDELNAFALPGGFLYVNTGLILEAETEAELAGILAHEIAHVTARHMTNQLTKARVFQWVTLPLLFVGGPVGLGIQQAMGLAVPMTFLKFKRNDEREADFLGLQYTYRAGYDPAALIDILERLKEREGEKESRLARVFSSHPMTRDRIQRAQAGIAAVLPDRGDYVVSTSGFDRIRARLRRLQQSNWIFEPGEEEGPKLRRRTAD
jgi:predicted Zn-dependent protease